MRHTKAGWWWFLIMDWQFACLMWRRRSDVINSTFLVDRIIARIRFEGVKLWAAHFSLIIFSSPHFIYLFSYSTALFFEYLRRFQVQLADIIQD